MRCLNIKDNKLAFKLIEKNIRKMNFGILSTADKEKKPHSVGVLYAVSPPNSKFRLYCITGKHLKKARNIKENPYIAFVIPFPHHLIRFAPSNCIQFQGTAEVISIDDEEANKVINSDWVLRASLKFAKKNLEFEPIIIKIVPNQKIHCFGIGISSMKMLKEHVKANYSVEIPSIIY